MSPLTPKGKNILAAMRKTYSTKKGFEKTKAKEIFNLMIEEKKLTGVEAPKTKKGNNGKRQSK